jgi:hemolysin activation/secretion protein
MGNGVRAAEMAAAFIGVMSVSGVATASSAQDAASPTAPDLSSKAAPPKSAAAAPKAPVPSPSLCPFAGQNLRVTLKHVTVQGATVVKPGEIDRVVAPLLGHDSDLSVVCQARDRVAKLFVDKGYRLTRVDLPPQRIQDGELKLTATEGYVSSVDTDGLSKLGPSAQLARDFLAPVVTHRPTPWNDVERAVLLARDIPGAEIGVQLHASPDGPGAIELVARAAGRRAIDLSTGIQDMGSRELGEVAGFARVDANSYTPWGERSSLLLYGTTTGRQKVAEGIESAFLGSTAARAELDVTYAQTNPQGAISALGIDGDFFDAKLGVTYPVLRSQSLNVVARAGFEFVDQRNSLGALQGLGTTPLLFRDKLRIFTVQGDLRWLPENVRWLTAGANVEVRQGVQGLGSSNKGDPDLSRAQGDPGATVVRASGNLRLTWGGRPALGGLGGPWIEVNPQLQWTDQSLLAYEQYQIGNFTVGRGYDPGAASGDRAYATQVQAGWPLGFHTWGFRSVVEPYVFYDAAHLENFVGYHTTVESAGGGIRSVLPWSLHLDITGAAPLKAPIPNAPTPGARLLVSLTRVFSFH